ncbi:TniQ family protein [Pseudomonas pergaminensis]
MVSRCFWHEEVHPVGQKWPWVPVMQRDELFSSWFIRCALCNACDAVEMARYIWPKRRIWTGDCDLSICSLALSDLQDRSGISASALISSSLVPICASMGLKLPPVGITPWVLSLGERNLRRAGGLQYCPCCFAESPFYRLQWRLAWYSCCPDHGVKLRDSCPHCSAVISPHRLDYQARNLARCHECAGLLSAVDAQEGGADEINLIRQADLILQGLPVGLNWPAMPVSEGFSFLKGLFRLVRVLANSPSVAGKQFLAAFDVDSALLTTPVDVGLKLECLSNAERSHYLSAVSRILLAGADRFRIAAERSQLCPSIRDAVASSDQSYLAQLLPQRPRRSYVRTLPASCSSPKSTCSVLKAWLRFKRKVLRTEGRL